MLTIASFKDQTISVMHRNDEVIEWDCSGKEPTYTLRKKTKAELAEDKAEDSRRAKERAEQDRLDEEYRLRAFHSQMTVGELIKELSKFPKGMLVGSFAPSDPNGPCTWERPVLSEVNGQLRIENEGQ